MSNPNPDAPPVPKRRGCLFYGCLTGAVLLLAFIVLVLVGVHYVKQKIYSVTDAQAMALPAVDISPARMAEVRGRLDAFKKALDAPGAARPLSLSGDDINALISGDPNWQRLKEHAYVEIQSNLFKGQVSIPLSETGLPLVKGRYLNGRAAIDVSLHSGVLYVGLAALEVKGKPVGESTMQQLRTINFAQNLGNDPKAAALFRRFESIEIKDGKLLITPKSKAAPDAAPAPQAEKP
jgi:hypothetical protein